MNLNSSNNKFWEDNNAFIGDSGSGGVIDAILSTTSTNAVQNKVITNAINPIRSDVSDLESDLGDLSELETTDKSSIVNAINEVAENINTFRVGRSDYSYTLPKYEEILDLTPVFTQTTLINYEKTVNGDPSWSTKGYTTNNIDVRFTITGGHSAIGVGRVDVICFIEDVSTITAMTVYLLGTSATRSVFPSTLVNGWNVISIYTKDVVLTTWETITGVRLYVARTTTTDSDIYIGKIGFNCPPKGNVIIVSDGAYKSFYDDGYPDLTAIGVPVTWALCPDRIINNDSSTISQAELATLADDSLSEFSFHSWNAVAESSASALDVCDSAIKCLRFLQKNGLLPTYPWRAATIQNNSPNVGALSKFVYATGTGASHYTLTYFPFPDPYDVGRIALQAITTTQMDNYFEILRKTHCTIVFYTHKIQSGSSTDITPENWSAFVTKLSTAIDAEYVNATTFNRLMMAYYNPLL